MPGNAASSKAHEALCYLLARGEANGYKGRGRGKRYLWALTGSDEDTSLRGMGLDPYFNDKRPYDPGVLPADLEQAASVVPLPTRAAPTPAPRPAASPPPTLQPTSSVPLEIGNEADTASQGAPEPQTSTSTEETPQQQAQRVCHELIKLPENVSRAHSKLYVYEAHFDLTDEQAKALVDLIGAATHLSQLLKRGRSRK